MPMIAFIGVRISWLMLARNSDFAWVAASAATLARSSSASRPLALDELADLTSDALEEA